MKLKNRVKLSIFESTMLESDRETALNMLESASTIDEMDNVLEFVEKAKEMKEMPYDVAEVISMTIAIKEELEKSEYNDKYKDIIDASDKLIEGLKTYWDDTNKVEDEVKKFERRMELAIIKLEKDVEKDVEVLYKMQEDYDNGVLKGMDPDKVEKIRKECEEKKATIKKSETFLGKLKTLGDKIKKAGIKTEEKLKEALKAAKEAKKSLKEE